MKYSTWRGFVALALVAFCVIGLVFRVGGGTLSSFGFDQIAAICPLGALEVMLGAKEVLLHPALLLAAVIVVVILTGKAFCAWACPVPWISQFFRPSRKKGLADTERTVAEFGKADVGHSAELPKMSSLTADEKDQLKSAMGNSCAGACPTADGTTSSCAACGLAAVGGKRDGLQLDSRHGVLIGALASAAVFGFPVFCLVCPIGLTFVLIITIWNTFTANDPTWALAIIPIVLLVELVFFRKWCHKICPMGALISLFSNLNTTLRPHVDEKACLRERGTGCHVCVDVCPEQVDPHSKRIPECSKCGVCVERCPVGAIAIK